MRISLRPSDNMLKWINIQYNNMKGQDLKKKISNFVLDSAEVETIKQVIDKNSKNIDKIINKIKNEDLFKISLQQKLNQMTTRIDQMNSSIQRISSMHNQQFEYKLENSEIFRQTVSKVQKNLINNFKLLQDTLNGNLQELNQKIFTMEQSFVGILHNQEKIILKVSTSNQINNRSIRIIESTIEDILKREDISLLQSNLKVKTETILNHTQQRINSIQSEFIQIQTRLRNEIKQCRQRINDNLRHSDKFNQINNEVSVFSKKAKNLEQKFIAISSKINGIQNDIAENEEDFTKFQERNRTEIKKIQDEFKSLRQATQTKIIEFKNQINSRSYEPLNTEPKSSNFDRARILSQNDLVSQEFEKLKNPINNRKQSESNFDSRKNSFANRILHQEQGQAIQGGIRGLLKKSKQKQKKSLPPKHNPLQSLRATSPFAKPQPLKRKDLPPLQKEQKYGLKSQRNQIDQGRYQQRQEQQQQEGFMIDEEGYLINAEGQYVLDQEGNPVQYTEEQIEQLRRQNLVDD